MFKYFTFLFIILGFQSAMAQIDIDDARALSEGTVVTVRGIVTNGAEQGIIRYIQDDTGAIPAYPGMGSTGNFPGDVERGMLVEVTGPLKIFRELLEIDPITSYTIISENNALPTPLDITPSQLGEETEGLLVKVSGVTFTEGGNLFGVGNYEITANGESSEIYVRSGHALIGTEIPQATVNITGLSSQFNTTYQLLPRDQNDLEIADDFFISSSPEQSNISTSGFTVSWQTNVASSSTVNYGLTPALGETIEVPGNMTTHEVTLTGLEAAGIYYVEAVSDNGTTVVTAAQKVYSTQSNSSGDMRLLFNNPVNANFSNGAHPDAITGAAMEAQIIEFIDNATQTIDCSIYNINRNTIVDALSAAHQRGVVVRYIHDNETANFALQNPSPPFPTLPGNAEGLMHNKFFVFDAEDVDNCWVMSGSTNMTGNNIGTDYNNMIFIQDQALARTYTIEFEEMWGTDGPNPGIFAVKFGPDKVNNTPHDFIINGKVVESYFSPSDNTTNAIIKAISTADTDVEMALLTFTNNELGTAVLNAHNSGITVRGIMNNINDQGSEFNFLTNNGVNFSEDNTTVSTHHKYCIIDAANPDSDPQVVTGSHNWSGGAETRNDENTLIIHDADIANIFLQEFEARWCEAMGGGASCVFTSTEEQAAITGVELNISPNPTSDFADISLEIVEENNVTINLLAMNGMVLQSRILHNVLGQHVERISLKGLPTGQYIVQLKIEGKEISKLLKVTK